MIDLLLANTLKSLLSTQFPEIYVGAPLDGETITLPAILIDLQSEVVVGSDLQRGSLTIAIESAADDTTREDHAARVEAVDAFLRPLSFEEYPLKLDKLVPVRIENRPVDRHWSTSLSYTAGFQRLTL
jgi:hypothetical protein